MPKMKPHKGMRKRVKLTATGRVKRKKAGMGHLMSHKSGGTCRDMRKSTLLKGRIEKNVKRALCEG